ncbi:granulocyte-macrophage colony-stimulating factor receptor subunit alpha-like isoform X2 [Hyperolius riggenbachi]
MEESDICYNFSCRFLDKTTWNTDILHENYKTVHLRMHPGFIATVSIALCENYMIYSEGKKTEFIYFAPQVYVSNVSCTVYNLTNLNCTWDWKNDAPDDIDYFFTLKLNSRSLACKLYFKRHGRKVGCHMKDLFLDPDNHSILQYKIRVWFSNHLVSFSKTFRTERIELLNPPTNISVSSANGNTKLEWGPPPSLNKISPNCPFQYHIRVVDTQSQTTEPFKDNPDIRNREYIISDLEKDKKYMVQIRAKKIYCTQSKYWGEWSHPIFIGKDKEVFAVWIIIVIIAIGSVVAIVSLLFLLILLTRCVKALFLATIPGPPEKLRHLLSPDDLNSRKCIAVHDEQRVPITEIEIVTGSINCQEVKPQ